MAWSIKNYNAWIKQARRAARVDLKTARAAYRVEKTKHGGPLRGVDVKKSRSFKNSVTAAQVAIARSEVRIRDDKKVRRSRGAGTGGMVAPGSDGGGGGGGGSVGGGISVSSIEAWDDAFDDFREYEDVEIDSSADYGED